MESEQKDESRIPERYRWGALKAASETDVLQRYRQALIDLGDGMKFSDRSVFSIFLTPCLRQPGAAARPSGPPPAASRSGPS